MGTIAQKLTKLQTTKSAIKQAIIDKGVTDVGDNFSTYPTKIGEIQSGGSGGGGQLRDMMYRLDINLPVSLSRIAVTNNGNKIYVLGGWNTSSYKSVDTIYELDILNKTVITKTTHLPLLLRDIGCSIINNKIYLFGGYVKTYTVSKNIYEYDIETDTIIQKTCTLSREMSAISCGTFNNKIYLFGGVNGATSYNNIYEYDSVTDTIVNKNNLPSPISFSGCCLINDKFYIVAGENNNTATNKVYEYDPVGNVVTTLPDLPFNNKYGSYGQINGKIYIIGGYLSGNDLPTTPYEYDIDTGITTAKQCIIVNKTVQARAITINNAIYSIGGIVGSYDTSYTAIYL